MALFETVVETSGTNLLVEDPKQPRGNKPKRALWHERTQQTKTRDEMQNSGSLLDLKKNDAKSVCEQSVRPSMQNGGILEQHR
mmetsp:Transcript_3134/g.8490  ORF Transcript_3134/g.8490 Transcript_3134/m.8490 type:complete len:83 (+) Transcript_3134:2411-2659(+)